jgi:hypothetical protein
MSEFLTLRQAAKILGVSKDYVRSAGVPCVNLPPGRSGSRGVRRYLLADILEWAEKFRERAMAQESVQPEVPRATTAYRDVLAAARQGTYGLRRQRKGLGGIPTREVRQITSPVPQDKVK